MALRTLLETVDIPVSSIYKGKGLSHATNAGVKNTHTLERQAQKSQEHVETQQKKRIQSFAFPSPELKAASSYLSAPKSMISELDNNTQSYRTIHCRIPIQVLPITKSRRDLLRHINRTDAAVTPDLKPLPRYYHQAERVYRLPTSQKARSGSVELGHATLLKSSMRESKVNDRVVPSLYPNAYSQAHGKKSYRSTGIGAVGP